MFKSFPNSRRMFLQNVGGGAAAFAVAPLLHGAEEEFVRKSQVLPTPRVALPTDQLGAPKGPRKRIAAITTAYWKYSHADDIITKFIEGYGIVGRIHNPHCRVVSLFIDQFPKTDIGRGMAARYSIPLVKSPAAALVGDDGKLAVDGVLLIGEHGDYPLNTKGQMMYPRRKLFEEIVKVFRRTGKSVPVFNDKHLSYSWENAKWMFDQSRALKFPMMAGSSVPVTWRRPPLSFKRGIELEAALAVGPGSFESYGFHNLELMQSFVEKRRGGETGVKAVQALNGEAAWEGARKGEWPAELIPAAVATLPKGSGKPYVREMLKNTIVFRVEYSDGFTAAVCLGGRFCPEFSFAAKVRGRGAPVGTHAFLPKPQRDHFSFLCNHIEVMFRSGRPSYPVERTLLVTGILDALHDSKAANGKRIATPHLAKLNYTPAEDRHQ